MDPNATLAALREALTAYNGTTDRDEAAWHATNLAMAVEDLDEWLSNGGFPPDAWNHRTVSGDQAIANFRARNPH